uniref:ankyrin repeat and SOCS box protein 2-like n=1 Tax=Centroberyx gerrardi TaxID=166262 RepID=UPI003AAB88F1
MKLDSLGNLPTSDATRSYSFTRSDGRHCVAWRRYDGSFYVTMETEDLVDPLAEAVRKGAVGELKELLLMAGHVTQKNHLGWTALHEAAAGRRKECVDMLVEAHPELMDRQTLKGQTPLLLAVLNDRPACARCLLERGADPNISDKDGETPLYKACEGEQTEIVSLLLAFGAGVKQRCLLGWTALHEASSRNHLQISELLVGAGADVNAADVYGVSPLFVAAQSGNREALDFLLNNGADIDQRAADGATPLYEACKNGHGSTVRLLLSHQADADKTTRTGLMPIHTAAHRGYEDIVSVLIPVSSRLLVLSGGISPLHVAAEQNHVEVLQVLIRAGFDVNARLSADRSAMYRDRRRTALYFTVVNSNTEAAGMLLRAGAEPGLDPFSPLLVAVRNGCMTMVRLLVEYGADVNADAPARPPNPPGHPSPAPPSTFPPIILFCLKNLSMLKFLLDSGCEAAACFQCEHGGSAPPAVRTGFRDDPGLQPDQAAPQFCDIMRSPEMSCWAEPVLHVLLDYVGNVQLCCRLTELLDRDGSETDQIKDRAKPPCSLKHLSRLQVRRQTGVQRLRLMETLPLPRRLISYLTHQEETLQQNKLIINKTN